MTNYIVISAMGTDKPGIVEKLSGLAKENDCNLLDSKMSQMGSEFVLMMMLSGENQSIENFSDQLPALADKLELTTHIKKTNKLQEPVTHKLYQVSVSALDHPGIVHRVTRFFSEHQVNVATLNTQVTHAPHTGAPVFELNMDLQVNVNNDFEQTRVDFEEFCEKYDLDGELKAAG